MSTSPNESSSSETPAQASASAAESTGRNEPCPCGSGKKYKRCHGVGAAPKVTPPATSGAAPTGMPGGFDPSQMDPAVMGQMMQAMQRLPKGQLQKLQSLMQRAMAGRDVTREAAELERSLPPDFQKLMTGLAPQMGGLMGGMGAPGAAAPAAEMTPEEARQIVEKAMAEGKVAPEEGERLIEGVPAAKPSLWKRMTGK